MSLRILPFVVHLCRVRCIRNGVEARYFSIHDQDKNHVRLRPTPASISLYDQTFLQFLKANLIRDSPHRTTNALKALWEEFRTILARRGKNAGFRRDQAKKDRVKNDKEASSASSFDGGNDSKDGKDNEKDPFRTPSEEEQKKGLKALKFLIGTFLLIWGVSLLMFNPQHSNAYEDTTWSNFISNLLPTGQVSKVVVFPKHDIAFVYSNSAARDMNGIYQPRKIYKVKIPSLDRLESEIRATEIASNLRPEQWTQIEYKWLEGVENFVGLAITLGLIALGYFLFKRSKISSLTMSDVMSNVMKSQINILDPTTKGSKLKIKFKDVAGLHEAKVEISEFVDYLKHPMKYTKLGARLPKGALLTGPPGCGKTLLAKALAAESSAPFISMNGTEFVEMIGGLGASRIRNLFKEAKSRAPCIIYIDEIDAVGRKRREGGAGQFEGSGSGEEEQTLNQLLVEMDGMDTTQGVIIIASTNRPDILDKALMRPGRFDRHINVDFPTFIERKELFEMYLKRIKFHSLSSDLLQRLAHLTPGFSGADINNVVNESAIRAATHHQKYVTMSDLNYAMEKVIAGPEKRSRVLVQEEREIVAYHESGHALVGWLLEHTDALLKVTIVPRTNAALGFAQYTPRDRKLFSQEELFDRMCMMLGGRAAENVIFGRVTTGAQNDLEKVTQQAYAQVKKYGMSKVVGPISFAGNPSDERAEQFNKKPYSKRLGQIIDEEVQGIVGRAYFFTEQLLRDNKEHLEMIAKALLERESLSYEDVKKLIGPPRYGDKAVVDVVEQVLPKDNEE